LSRELAAGGLDITQHAEPTGDASGSAHLAATWCDAWRAEPPDVIHAHTSDAGNVALAAARALEIPVVVSADERLCREPGLMRAAARIIAGSSADVFELLGRGAAPGSIKLIPHGVDLSRYVPLARIVEASAPFRIVALGHPEPEGGIADLMTALVHLPGVELIVGGGGATAASQAETRALAVHAAALGVTDRVRLLGPIARDAVPAFLRSGDLLVSVPWHTSSGAVVLEAMACGVPVVASAVGAQIDAIADGISGALVTPASPRQLAYTLSALIGDPVRRARFARFGLERVTARHGWSRIAAEVRAVYAGVATRVAVEPRRASVLPFRGSR
jgi:glycosyltransferase involved in cell wall biosynthesis